MVFFLLLTLCLTYSAIWYQLPEIACLLFALSAIFNLIIVTKLYKSNTKLKNELRKNFYIDLNTKLPNRLKLLKDTKELDPDIESTLIIINIDSFQNTNNFYGHNFGDKFLKVIGNGFAKIFLLLMRHCISLKPIFTPF